MENNPEYIELLISLVLSGEAKPSQKEELDRWINESPRNKQTFDENKRIWDNSPAYFPKEEILSDFGKIKVQINSIKPTKVVGLSFWLTRIAAILALPIMLSIGWYWGSKQNNIETQTCEVTAPKGQISKCVLADGTQVWLNAGSTIKYEPTLKGSSRNVMLDGEAYFIVSKNKHKPFIVSTKHARIKVLGTVFNLKAYSGDNKVETTLEEGSVEFSVVNGSSSKPIELKPGEQVVYSISENKTVCTEVETYLHTAWKDGKYVFKDAELKDIITELERLYDVKFHVQNDSLLHMHFRGMFEYDQNIFSALERLELTTNMKYKMEGRQIWLQ